MGSEMDYTYEERQRDVNAGLYQRFFFENEPGDVISWVVGDEDTNAIEVSGQIADLGGAALEAQYMLEVYMADDADGTPSATAPDGGVAVSVGSEVSAIEAGLHLSIKTDATGAFEITVTESSATSFWLAVKLPSGKVIMSPELAFIVE